MVEFRRPVSHCYTIQQVIHGSAFGNISSPIGVSSVKCNGDESNFGDCPVVHSYNCPTKMYASVFCSKETIKDLGLFIILPLKVCLVIVIGRL